MIVELFGLPGSGKTTLAKAFAEEGAVIVPASGRWKMIGESVLFFFLHPIRALRLFFFIFSHAPKGSRMLLIENLFFAANAKYRHAQRISRKGKVAVIDQGYFQALLSLFENAPDIGALRKLVRILPKPDVLLVLDTSKEERERRVEGRGRAQRPAAGESVFPAALDLFKAEDISHLVVPGTKDTKLLPLLIRHVSYVTHARMPTEKAHGVSIAHMCASFAKAGREALLVIPRRKNPVREDIFSFYGVPANFSVREIVSKDFLGMGLTNPFFFFLQRLSFLYALKNPSVPSGIVYTREPEIACKFSRTHLAVFEAHRWPSGFAGWLQARLVRNAALIVCNSRGTEAAAKRYGLVRTVVAPNGFDPALFENVEPKKRSELGLPQGTVALYAGSDGPGKGADIVRAAAKKLEQGQVSIGIIGTGKKQLSPPFYELGRVSPAEVPRYLISADILILPNTREGESETYTSPIKLFEYLAAGKAIIASDLPSIREILTEESAYFVPSGDPQALAEAIQTLAKDNVLRAKLSERTKALSTSYTWNARAKLISASLTF